jgi:predicted ATPase/class 3 adenylate cyclase
MAAQTHSALKNLNLPSGTITFLFSDIEGSTARWQNLREAMADALARHDRVVRAAIERSGGYVFKTVGDAFCAAFQTAPSALEAAVSTARVIASEDFSAVGGLHVRLALHAGTAHERDGDYFGPAVNRVARLLAAAHGGQVLVSAACAELLQGELPQDCSLRDLGRHRLKDLALPEHIYQLVAAPLRESFPPLRSLDNLSNNLPPQLTSFVGREGTVAQIKILLEQHALVTLVGTGGAGKTRCAIQVGAELLDGSGDGVWLAELAPISEPSLVCGVVARSLGVPEAPNHPIIDTLLDYLKTKRLLLIIDNCEHVIDEARRLIAAVLHSCPDVIVLATSREALNIEGEQLFHMPSLSTPSAHEQLSRERLLAFGAPLLFMDRALAADERFTVTDDNAANIVEICRRLDGIPLAIELAAARVKVLSPKQLGEKLNERFRILTGGDRSALPRHQTMRALIDWSYELLSENERRLFRQLSIFAGTFSLESAVAVCGTSETDEIAVLDLLTSLVDKSLLHTEALPSGTRYRLLESTRHYARERVIEQNEYTNLALAHATAFLAEAEELERTYETTADDDWGSQVEPDLENWRAALEWALLGHNDVCLGQRLTGAMRWTWMFFSPAEGLRWVHIANETVDDACEDAVIAKLDLAAAEFNITLIQYIPSYEASLRALRRFEQLGDARGTAEAGWAAGRSAVFIGLHDEGDARLNSALTSAERLGLRKLTCWIIGALAQNRIDTDDLDTPEELYAKALAIAKSNRFDRMAAVIAGMVAEYKFRRGKLDEAVQYAKEACQAARTRKDRRSVINTLMNTAAYLVELGEYNEAANDAREALILSRDSRAAVHVAVSLQHLAAVAAMRPKATSQDMGDDSIRAAYLLGYVDAQMRAIPARREYTEEHEYQRLLVTLQNMLGEEQCAACMRAGSAWTQDIAVEEALRI